MSDTIQTADKEVQPKVWRVLQHVTKHELEDTLNEMSEDGYQVYRMDRLDSQYFDVVFFNPVLISTKQANDIQRALAKAGLDAGSTSKAGS